MRQIVQRICWNTNGWQYPSGDGRYESKKSYPFENGFGLEEWNFRTAHAFEGYVYGYMNTAPKIQKQPSQNIFDIYFYTIEPRTGQKLVIGMYKAATRASAADQQRLSAYYKKSGIFKDRARELVDNLPDDYNPDVSELNEIVTNTSLLKVKCRDKNVVRFDEPYLLQDLLSKRIRYGFTTYADITKTKRAAAPKPSQSQKNSQAGRRLLNENEFYRDTPSTRKKVIPQHNRLSNKFCSWLRKKDITPTQERDWVDVWFKLGQETCLVEIKICQEHGTRKAIREAMGQVLEYNYYPGRSTADLWIIVLDQKPTQNDRRYIRQIRETLHLPITVAWTEGAEFKFEKQPDRL